MHTPVHLSTACWTAMGGLPFSTLPSSHTALYLSPGYRSGQTMSNRNGTFKEDLDADASHSKLQGFYSENKAACSNKKSPVKVTLKKV